MLQKIKKTKIAQTFKKSFLCRWMKESCGDWRYPWIGRMKQKHVMKFG